MWFYLLIILGTCVIVIALGFLVYWIIIKKNKTLWTNRSVPPKGETQNDSSFEQPLNETYDVPDIQRNTDTDAKYEDWLNNDVPETPAITIKKEDDDWLNAGEKEPPTDVYKQYFGEGPNAENIQPSETADESSLTRAATERPEIQINKDGPILDITVTSSKKRDAQSEQIVFNLKINLPPQFFVRKGKEPFDIEITDDSSPSFQNLQDNITIKPGEEPVIESHPLMDEISIRPLENQVNETHSLMDEITVRPVESLVVASPQLVDEISVRPLENQVNETHSLMDEITIKPSSGPVNIEYELLDDLITKSANYRVKKAKPYSDVVVTNPVESPIEKAKPYSDVVVTNPVESPIEKAKSVKTISINEITKYLNAKSKQTTIPSIATEFSNIPSLTRTGEGLGYILNQAKSLYKKVKLLKAVKKALATLRIFNNSEFYIQDFNLTHVDTKMETPQIKDFIFKVVNTATELDELIKGGYNLVININEIKRGLKKGMVAFLAFVDKELASIGWSCLTEESKATFRSYPYNDDLDRQACIVGDWTNTKFRDSGILSYVQNKRHQLLKEKGFSFERSTMKERIVQGFRSMMEQERLELIYKHRTYTNVSLFGILGVEFWKELPLKEIDSEPLYKMITLSILVLPSPPRVADLNKQLMF